MADYHSPTVIQPTIPSADMTALERLILGHIFDTEADGDGLYLFAEIGPSDSFELPVRDLRRAIAASADTESTVNAYISERIAALTDDDTHVEIDLSGMSWEFILQDIVRRSPTLDHVTAISAFTCTRMRPDGFDGMAVVITADAIRGKSTNDIVEDFLGDDAHDALYAGTHVLLRVREHAVKEQIAEAIGADPDLTSINPDAVTESDIRSACLDVVACSDLSEEQGAAEFRAAVAAIRAAERRDQAPG
ncbi:MULTISPECIES: hypothetical protein [Xanthobacteraceae]|jgi:hypothetical protein|uniref:hypothetical protein n=1 Tax=Xanthobacteraceae TaxID=335928 RepID=UPI00372BD3FB